jgi:hypothetical protein
MVAKRVDYICRQLGQLRVIEQIPVELPAEHHQLFNRATDVISTVLVFLAVNIRRAPGVLGVPGTFCMKTSRSDANRQHRKDYIYWGRRMHEGRLGVRKRSERLQFCTHKFRLSSRISDI